VILTWGFGLSGSDYVQLVILGIRMQQGELLFFSMACSFACPKAS